MEAEAEAEAEAVEAAWKSTASTSLVTTRDEVTVEWFHVFMYYVSMNVKFIGRI